MHQREEIENDVEAIKQKLLLHFSLSFVFPFILAKRLPKSEPQPAGGSSGRNRGVDLTEAAQPAKAPCCSN